MKEIVKEKTSINSTQLELVSQEILHSAANAGASHAEVSITANKGFSVSACKGEVETVEYNQDKVIEITVFFGHRTGSASLSDIRPEAINAAVSAACHIAKFTDADEAAGLADKSELAFDYPTIDVAKPWNVTVEEAIQLACECERKAVSFDKRIMSAEESSVATIEQLNIYANSLGFLGTFPQTRHEISCVLVAKEKDEMYRDYSYTIATDPANLASTSEVALDAARKTIDRLGSRTLSTMKAPVIFIAEEARGLISHFVSAISGGSLYRKSSFLVDHLNQKIFPDFFHLEENPYLARALGSAPFDNEGVRTRKNIFIENGILKSYALSSYSARKLHMKTTGNAGGIHNLIVRPGKKTLVELLKTMQKGLVVTELMGHGVNLLTGDYSRGVGGFWVENGEIQYPVHEITIASNLRDMYAHIVEVGNDVDIRGNIRTGSILIEEMMIAGS